MTSSSGGATLRGGTVGASPLTPARSPCGEEGGDLAAAAGVAAGADGGAARTLDVW